MTIYFKRPGAAVITSKTLHIQDIDPLAEWKKRIRNGDEDPEIVMLWADGHELDYITKVIQNIPFRHGYCFWKTPWAAFIFDNL